MGGFGPSEDGRHAFTWQEALDFAAEVNPTVDRRVAHLEQTVSALGTIWRGEIADACRDPARKEPRENRIVYLTPFGYVQRIDGAWVPVTGPLEGKEPEAF